MIHTQTIQRCTQDWYFVFLKGHEQCGAEDWRTSLEGIWIYVVLLLGQTIFRLWPLQFDEIDFFHITWHRIFELLLKKKKKRLIGTIYSFVFLNMLHFNLQEKSYHSGITIIIIKL